MKTRNYPNMAKKMLNQTKLVVKIKFIKKSNK